MPHVDCGAATLHYEVTGTADGPWLLLSNSLGTDLSMWAPQLPALEQYYRVLRYDMRGHGESSVPAGPYSIAQLGGDVLGLLDALHIQQTTFCGLSIGGVIGQWLAVHATDRITRLILCNTAAKIGTAEIWNDRIARVRSDGMHAIAGAVTTRWFSESFSQSSHAEVARLRAVLASTSPQGYIASCEAIRDLDQREMVKQVTHRTLIVVGAYDPVTTLADGEALHGAIHGSVLATVPGSHISNVEASSDFNAAVLRFLQEDTAR